MRGPRLPANLLRGARDAELAAAARRRARARYGQWYLNPALWDAEFRCRREGGDPEVVLPERSKQLKAARRDLAKAQMAAKATEPGTPHAGSPAKPGSPGSDAKAPSPEAAPAARGASAEGRSTQHIATLYSGRMYRDYLRKRGSRLPHYLNVPNARAGGARDRSGGSRGDSKRGSAGSSGLHL